MEFGRNIGPDFADILLFVQMNVTKRISFRTFYGIMLALLPETSRNLVDITIAEITSVQLLLILFSNS